jgi:hypothetical protein
MADRNTWTAVSSLERLAPIASSSHRNKNPSAAPKASSEAVHTPPSRWDDAVASGITRARGRRGFKGVLADGMDGADFAQLLAATVVLECVHNAVDIARRRGDQPSRDSFGRR